MYIREIFKLRRWNDSNINYCQRKKKRGRCGRKMNAKIKFFRIWRYIRCRELRTKQKESAILPSFHMCNTSLALCFVFRTEAHGKLLVKPKRFFFFLTKLHRQVPWIQIISASANLSVISLDLKALSWVSFLTIRINVKEESHVDSFFLSTCNLSKYWIIY